MVRFEFTSIDTVSEWLRRWTRNPLGSARRGSNPLAVDFALRAIDAGLLQVRNLCKQRFNEAKVALGGGAEHVR